MENNQDFDIIIQAGQSNAEGCGRGDASEPYVPMDNVLYLSCPFEYRYIKLPDGIEFQEIFYPSAPYYEIATEREISGTVGDFSLSFAREYIRSGRLASDRKLLIIRAAVGGTGFAKGFWLPGGVCFLKLRALIEFAKSIKGDNRFVAFLWHQGEHDAFENDTWDYKLRKAEYSKNFQTLIVAVREQCRSSLPVIAAGFCNDWAHKKENIQGCSAVAEATREVLKYSGHAAFIETNGLHSNKYMGVSETDDIHFCRESLYELGKRYYKAYEKVCYNGKE